MRVDSAVVGMTGDQNISEKEKKNVQAKKTKHFHKHLTKKCNKQQTMNDAPRRLAKCTFPDFFLLLKFSYSKKATKMCAILLMV